MIMQNQSWGHPDPDPVSSSPPIARSGTGNFDRIPDGQVAENLGNKVNLARSRNSNRKMKITDGRFYRGSLIHNDGPLETPERIHGGVGLSH
jgi:hypothetical protein